MKKIICLFAVLIFLNGCASAAYRGWTKMEIRGDDLKRGIMGGITGKKVVMILIRETSTSENGPMCCAGKGIQQSIECTPCECKCIIDKTIETSEIKVDDEKNN